MNKHIQASVFCERHSFIEKKIDKLNETIHSLRRRLLIYVFVSAFAGGWFGSPGRVKEVLDLFGSIFSPARPVVAEVHHGNH